MIASDVATKLTLNVPKYTDVFSDSFDIATLSSNGTLITVGTTTENKLSLGDSVTITDVPVPIGITSLTRTVGVGTLVTLIDHDLTTKIAPTITIEDSTESNFNGVFKVIQIVNRRTIKFTIADSGSSSATGGKIINAGRFNQGYNGLYSVASIVSPTIFTVSNPSAIQAASILGKGKVKTGIRITASASLPRAIDSYTKQNIGSAWMFVVLGDSSASKDRRTNTDLTTNMTRSNFFRQQVQETVSLYVIANTKTEIAGRKIRDDMQIVFLAISRAIAFFQFDTNFTVSKSDPLFFVSHGVEQYDGALYVHSFNFECATEYTFEDTIGYDNDVRFGNIDMTADQDIGTKITAIDQMDLDDEEFTP